jgi:PAS domain S-box-containing protein
MPRESTLVAKLSTAQGQLRILQGEVATLAEGEKFGEELESLQSRLVELEVAYQELEEQNDELLSTREALENQRHRYLRLFDEAPFGYLVTGFDGVIEEANREVANLLGIAQQHLEGKPFLVYLLPKDRSSISELISRARAGEASGEREVRIRPRGGKPFSAMVTVARDLEGRSGKLRWAIRDVSQTRAMEEALRLS